MMTFEQALAYHRTGQVVSPHARSVAAEQAILDELNEAIRLLREHHRMEMQGSIVSTGTIEFLARHTSAPYKP